MRRAVVRSRIWRIRAWLAGSALAASGCTLFHPLALPKVEDVLAQRRTEDLRVELAVSELANPLLAPLPVDLTDGVSPEEAAVLAAVANPDLVAARDARGEAGAALLAAGLLPNPLFGFEGLQPYGSNSAGLTLAQAFHLSIDTSSLVTRGARIDAAQAEAEQVDLGIAWQEWQVAESARLGAERLGWLRRRLALARAQSDLLATGVDALERARRAGDATAIDLGIERAAFEAARQARRELEGVESTTESELLATLGLSPAGHLDVEPRRAPSDAELEVPPLEAVLEGCLAHRLDLEALRHGYVAEEARLREAVLEQLPGVTVGLSQQKDETSLRFLGGFVELNLPVFDRSQARIALSEATRVRLAHEYEARVLSMRQEVDALLRALRTLGEQIPEVRVGVLAAGELEAGARSAFEQGDIDRLSYHHIRSSLFDLELTLESLSQAHAEARVGLALACGRNFETAATAEKGSHP